ncbi:MAG: DUF721 domain-containing protein [Nitrospira sp. SB0675_bin_23]|nr:DUF721 domain-containing protein [Nitrospira sp. SB0667_bin_9]MYD31257.1 DUF721 domain-containing protein [Nitrospira sp. SB0661_bin_20]MYH01037.1 DUF721 domain-containing protein [Nitrospira sp. SB0675_bin_23]MYJ23526.1 DUF721 domain-containing protein [Nitrospira sp. SB0673_bin_12]
MPAFSSSKSLIEEISQSHGFASRLWEYRLQRQWKGIVGEVVAAHTWPTRIKFRKLHVAVDNSVWLHQLRYLKATLLESIQTQMEELQLEDIIFRIGELPESREDDVERPAEQVAVSPEAHKTARESTQSVNDDELRDSLTKVIARALSSGQHSK